MSYSTTYYEGPFLLLARCFTPPIDFSFVFSGKALLAFKIQNHQKVILVKELIQNNTIPMFLKALKPFIGGGSLKIQKCFQLLSNK